MRRFWAVLVAFMLLLTGCGSSSKSSTPKSSLSSSSSSASTEAGSTKNIYAKDGPNMFVDATKDVPYRIYVPNSDETSMMEIDPNSGKVTSTLPVGTNPQHVVPSWDLKTLYVTNDLSNSLTPIDPKTGAKSGKDIPVDDPYNMYFTPDGKNAIVVAEARQNLDFRDPHTFALKHRVHVDCSGVDHIDFAADNSYLIATCEFSGRLVKVSLPDEKVMGYMDLRPGAVPAGRPQPQDMETAMRMNVPMPQDIKVDPQGKIFYVADMTSNGLWMIDGDKFTNTGFMPTGPETHGLYPSRDAKYLYVSNRGGMQSGGNKGSVSVIDFATRKMVSTWTIPAPSTPDMGGVSPDGKVLWLSGRRNSEVYAIDTNTGKLIYRIPVGKGPHGLSVWPQPGTYSLGHTGILR